MQFEILQSQGLARIGKVYLKSNAIATTPTIITSNVLLPQLKGDTVVKLDLLPNSQDSNEIEATLPRLKFYPTIQHLESLENIWEQIIKDSETVIPILPLDTAAIYLNSYHEYLNALKKDLIDILPENFGIIFPYQDHYDFSQIKELLLELRPKVTVLPDIKYLISSPDRFINYISAMNECIPAGIMRYSPNLEPKIIPLAHSIGIDLFDLNAARIATSLHYFFFGFNTLKWEDLKEKQFKCTCSACQTSLSDVHEQILKHNQLAIISTLELTRMATFSGEIRDLVRQTINIHPHLKMLYRKLAKTLLRTIEPKKTPIYRKNRVLCTDETDLYRAEFERFRYRIENFYYPSSKSRLILVLPCSARKPYSSSKSHKKFREIIKRVFGSKQRYIEEIIFTSPLGLVPRMLERTYPAAHYDIAVTGDWEKEEIQLVSNVTKKYFLKVKEIFKHIPIVVHLNPTETEIFKESGIEDLFDTVTFTHIEGSPQSNENLTILEKTLQEYKEQVLKPSVASINDYDPPPNSNEWLFASVTRFQFQSPNITVPLLTKNFNTKGKIQYQLQFYQKNMLLGTYQQDYGLISLGIGLAKHLSDKKHYYVVYQGNEIHGSALYCTAIEDADPRIAPGDEVVIINRDGQLLGYGRSLLTSTDLIESDRGIGVKIRKKIK